MIINIAPINKFILAKEIHRKASLFYVTFIVNAA